jgi:hypothetical protein
MLKENGFIRKVITSNPQTLHTIGLGFRVQGLGFRVLGFRV